MKKGFTLIELLAVIVILAIIALIATPIVLSIINDSKEAATLRSAEFYLDAVQQAIMQKKQEIRRFKPSVCEVQIDGNVLCDEEVFLEINVDGQKPDGGVIKFSSGEVVATELIYESQTIRNDTSGTLVQGEEFGKLSTEQIVYFDVSKGTTCSASEYNDSNSNTGYNGIDNKTGNQNSCLKFYLFNDNGGDNVTLLLDHNTTAVVAWNSSGINTSGPTDVLTQLQNDTANWQGTITPTNQTIGPYTVNYTGYKAKLLSALEITQFVGYSVWNEHSTYFFETNTFFEKETCTAGNTSECRYGWLYDRTDISCKAYGCLYNSDVDTSGYWTSTYRASQSTTESHLEKCNGSVSYGVSHRARLGYTCVDNSNHYGVRPAILVSRNKIS